MGYCLLLVGVFAEQERFRWNYHCNSGILIKTQGDYQGMHLSIENDCKKIILYGSNIKKTLFNYYNEKYNLYIIVKTRPVYKEKLGNRDEDCVSPFSFDVCEMANLYIENNIVLKLEMELPLDNHLEDYLNAIGKSPRPFDCEDVSYSSYPLYQFNPLQDLA